MSTTSGGRPRKSRGCHKGHQVKKTGPDGPERHNHQDLLLVLPELAQCLSICIGPRVSCVPACLCLQPGFCLPKGTPVLEQIGVMVRLSVPRRNAHLGTWLCSQCCRGLKCTNPSGVTATADVSVFTHQISKVS